MPHSAPTPTHEVLTKLFPGLTEQQYADLDAWCTGYASLILSMFERITGDPEAYEQFLALTSHSSRPTMTGRVEFQKPTDKS
jgi:hypothetical protein